VRGHPHHSGHWLFFPPHTYGTDFTKYCPAVLILNDSEQSPKVFQLNFSTRENNRIFAYSKIKIHIARSDKWRLFAIKHGKGTMPYRYRMVLGEEALTAFLTVTRWINHPTPCSRSVPVLCKNQHGGFGTMPYRYR
jgi:hypothetical protein